MLSNYQVKIADFYYVPIGNVTKLVPIFLVEKNTCLIMKTYNFFKVRNEAKKLLLLQFNQSQWLKPYVEFNTQKWIEAEKYDDKDGKALQKLLQNASYAKKLKA